MSFIGAIALLGSYVLAGICNDKRTDCANWAKDGECAGENAVSILSPQLGPEPGITCPSPPLPPPLVIAFAGRVSSVAIGAEVPIPSYNQPHLLSVAPQKYMAEICPLSCGVCSHVCNDTDASCGSWAQQGECESNPDAMLRICPTSCGLCTPECKDLKPDCPGWGASGECNENPEYMVRNCPVTCEACKSTCKDVQSDCPGWTADGECYKNPGFMYKECPGSCGVCEGVKCADKNVTQCQIWADAGECVNNPLAVMKECPDSCGVCRRPSRYTPSCHLAAAARSSSR